MDFLKIYKHLLPRGLAWSLTSVGKSLRKLFEGLSFSFVRLYFDQIWLNIFPSTTEDVEGWNSNFGLPDFSLNEEESRVRLAARWQAQGGQNPRYIQDVLQGAGFNVFVHEWWEPGSEADVGVSGCAVPRNPVELLKSSFELIVGCGSPVAYCGSSQAFCGATISPEGYILSNKDVTYKKDWFSFAGNVSSYCGSGTDDFCGFTALESGGETNLTLNSSKWPFFLYIGGETFPELAEVDINRRAEFEELVLKIRPLQQWLGMLVVYN